jgi:putative membrane protein
MTSVVVAASGPWQWVARPTVWFLIVGLVAMYWYAVTRIGPRAALPGEVVVSRSQVAWFAGAMLTLWVSSDWPLHDIGEDYLYSAHMVQHLLLSFALPPMALLATPTWLARLVVGRGRGYTVVRWLARPVQAIVIFNAVVVLQHWPLVVNTSVTNGPFHYGVHLLVVASAFVMWLPIVSPLPELRPSLPVQMMFLFAQSVIPTVPAGWLTFAESTVYKAYDVPFRLFGLSAANDQQLAGMVMKVVGGMFLWVIIAILFIRFATQDGEDDRASGATLDRRAPESPRRG